MFILFDSYINMTHKGRSKISLVYNIIYINLILDVFLYMNVIVLPILLTIKAYFHIILFFLFIGTTCKNI